MALDLTTSTGFTASDLFLSAMSLAANFWPFLLLGLAFLLAPWAFSLVKKALTAHWNHELHQMYRRRDTMDYDIYMAKRRRIAKTARALGVSNKLNWD